MSSLLNSITGNVPQKYAENKQLGTWVNMQRMLMKERTDNGGDENIYPKWKVDLLKKAGFKWYVQVTKSLWVFRTTSRIEN